MKKFLILILLIPFTVFAQITDTTKFNKLISIESLVDSLRIEIYSLEKKLQLMKENVVEGSEFDKLLSTLEEGDEAVPDDQRSSNRRLDALLQVMTNRPGQIRFNGSAVSVIHNKLSGKNFSSAVGLVDLYATTSFGGESIFFIYFQAKGGNGLDSLVNSFVSTDANAGSTQSSDGQDVVLIPEAWAEFSLLDNDLKFTVGKLDLTNYFDNNAYANDEYSQFITSGFVNSAALPIVETTPGIRMRTNIFNRFFIQVAFASSSNSGTKIFSSIFKAASIGFKIFADSDYEGNLRVYGYLHPDTDDKAGYGISFDKNLFEELGLFIRWNKNSSRYSKVNNIKQAWSTGVLFKDILFNRKFSTGVAIGSSKGFSNVNSSEYNTELFARFQINKWVYLSPHFQGIWNIAGSKKNTYLAALKAQINF
jgi:carbohydrate-selective porin (OprB family)